jgi:hypothetical protein
MPFRALKFRRSLQARLPVGAKVPRGARHRLETPASAFWTGRIAPTQKREIRMPEPYSATTRSLRRPAAAWPWRSNGYNRIDRSSTCPPGQAFRSHADRAAARKMLVGANFTEPRIAFDADSNRFRAAHGFLTPLTSMRDVRSTESPPPVREQIHHSPFGGGQWRLCLSSGIISASSHCAAQYAARGFRTSNERRLSPTRFVPEPYNNCWQMRSRVCARRGSIHHLVR